MMRGDIACERIFLSAIRSVILSHYHNLVHATHGDTMRSAMLPDSITYAILINRGGRQSIINSIILQKESTIPPPTPRLSPLPGD